MDEKIIKIASFFDYTQAEITKIALEDEGIDCFLSGENFVATYWLYANADGGIKLYIKESDKEKALEILKNIRGPKQSEADPSYDLKCPRCDSTDVEFVQRSRWFPVSLILALATLVPSLLVMGAPLAVLRNACQCKTCGYKWKEEKTERNKPAS